MHFKKTLVVLMSITVAGCVTPPKATDRLDVDRAKTCISTSLQELGRNPKSAEKYVDLKYVASRIAKSFDVSTWFVARKKATVAIAFTSLASQFKSNLDGEIVIETYQQGDAPGQYILIGTIGEYKTNLDAHFFADGSCLIRDAKVEDSSIIALLIGILSGLPGFIELVEMDPYAQAAVTNN